MRVAGRIRLISYAAVAALLCGCHKAPSPADRALDRPIVTVEPVRQGRITQRLELTGDVRPWATVLLSSKVPGRLERLGMEADDGSFAPLSEGTVVRQGTRVARIDLAVYETVLKKAQAAAAIAEAQLADAEREERRMLALFKEGSATEQMRDKAVSAKAIAEAGVAQARAALALAALDVEEARPRAPIDGVVTRKHVDEGNLVSVGMPLATIETLSRVKILLNIPERYLSAVKPGQTKLRLASDAWDQTGIEATVDKVYPAVDPATRTGVLEVELDNVEGRLRPGSFVHASLEMASREDAVVVPLSAITWQGSEAFVFVAENGRARRRVVQVGIREQERCEIAMGLRPGDLLIVEGFRNVRDGDPVTVQGGARP